MWIVTTVPLPGVPPVTQVDYSHGHVLRISLRETTGAASAVVRFWDGSQAAGILLDSIALTPGQSTRDMYRSHQYRYTIGLFIQVVSGLVEGAVVIGKHEHGECPGDPIVLMNPEVLALSLGAQ